MKELLLFLTISILIIASFVVGVGCLYDWIQRHISKEWSKDLIDKAKEQKP